MSSSDNHEQVLELLKAHVESQKDAIKHLEQKALHNLVAVNIIAGIVAAFNLPFIAGDVVLRRVLENQREVYAVVLILSSVFVAVCAMVALLSVRVLRVRTQSTHPMDPTEDNIRDWTLTDTPYFQELIRASYLQIYQNNAHIVDGKGDMVRWSHRLMTVLILLILACIIGLCILFFRLP